MTLMRQPKMSHQGSAAAAAALPSELLRRVLGFLPVFEAVRARLVCSSFCEWVDELPHPWRRLRLVSSALQKECQVVSGCVFGPCSVEEIVAVMELCYDPRCLDGVIVFELGHLWGLRVCDANGRETFKASSYCACILVAYVDPVTNARVSDEIELYGVCDAYNRRMGYEVVESDEDEDEEDDYEVFPHDDHYQRLRRQFP
jgi:hypothetical protein